MTAGRVRRAGGAEEVVMHIVGALFLIFMGAGVLAVAWNGIRTGEVPAGANFFRGTWRPSREDNPVAFHFFLLLYLCGGAAMVVWGLLILAGKAAPLPL